MGKSHKKVKNDRINAIRKQYDAFLEEDKKRRERNEFILGQLDKMRSTTALVPITRKENYHLELNPSEIYLRPNNLRPKVMLRDAYAVSNLERHNENSSLLNTSAEELRILKEISKKYILIPKRTKPMENEIIYSRDVDDADWKAKYNILDDLKKLEKEGRSEPVYNKYNDDNNNMQNKELDLSMDVNNPGTPSSNLGIHTNHFEMETPEKNDELSRVNICKNAPAEQDKGDSKQVNFNGPQMNDPIREKNEISLHNASVSDKILRDEEPQPTHITQECINNPQQELVTENEKYNTECNEKDFNSITINNAQISDMNNAVHPTVNQENDSSSDNNTFMVDTNKQMITPENNNAETMNAISEQTISQAKSLEHGNAEHLDQTIQNQKDTNEIRDKISNERVELYDDVDPEGQIVANETTVENPPNYDPIQNTIPVDAENMQHPQHVEHEAEINAFEAEQKEMFYSEESNADAYGYNQGEENTGEYPQGYEQNDQYGYYEGVQQEQAYATDINEHEESTERYDPHYNEQYEGTYEHQQPDNPAVYENTNAYEQQQFEAENQQLENIVNYDNQQENTHLYQQETVSNVNEVQDVLPQDDQMYDQQLYAENTVAQEHIEQQLIAEEGYTESVPVTTDGFQKETEGEIENVLDTVTPEEPILENPNMS